MKNSILSALLALGIGLMPGFGLNFMNGNPVNWGHADAVENPAAAADVAPDPAARPRATVSQHAQTIEKNKVASAASSYNHSTQ